MTRCLPSRNGAQHVEAGLAMRRNLQPHLCPPGVLHLYERFIFIGLVWNDEKP